MSVLLRRLRASRAVLALMVVGGGALIGATGAGAGPAVATTTPTTYVGTNTCTGETFTGTGTLHFLLTDNLSASGVIEFHLDARFDGLKAVTLTGKKYVVQDTFNWEFVFSRAAEETFAVIAHYVRVGEDGSFVLGDDFYQYIRTHITANANGVVTVERVEVEDQPCQ